MQRRTTCGNRREFYERHQAGETYPEMASHYGVSKECVRYWCRHQRDGGSCETIYRRTPPGLLSQFHPLVRYCILRLRLEHPHWGPNRIWKKLEKRSSLRGLPLPSEASIGRYLHQWARFHRRPKKTVERARPRQPTAVHQRWQMDFKLGIGLQDGSQVNLHTVRDPVGEACLGAVVFPVEKVATRGERVTLDQVRWVLRRCFTEWNTLPDEVQTDGEPVLVTQSADAFPTPFTLWLKGLGIEHLIIRPGKPTDNAEVERCHRTITDYAIVGNEDQPVHHLQSILDEAVLELAFDLPSRAEGCGGRPPIEAHPELLEPRRPFRPEHELALFDLKRVDTYLATFTWQRKVSKTGQICLAGRHTYYGVGRKYARRQVLVKFDPADRHFVFYDVDKPGQEVRRRPARNLAVEDLTGLVAWPEGLVPQQLPLPLFLSEGVNC